MRKLRLEGPERIPGGEESGWYKVRAVQVAGKEMDGEAWHGTTMYAVYNILRDGMCYESHRTKQGKSGVYAHDLQTRHKAIHYGGVMEIQEGIFVKALVQLATNSEHRKRLKQSDQMVFDPDGVEALAVWFKFYGTDTIENGTRISKWIPGLEAPVGNVQKADKDSTTDTPKEDTKEARREEGKHPEAAPTKEGRLVWRESGQTTETAQGCRSGSNNPRNSEAATPPPPLRRPKPLPRPPPPPRPPPHRDIHLHRDLHDSTRSRATCA